MKSLYRKFKSWLLKWSGTKWGPWVLFLCAFADSSFFGLPVPVLFVALALLNIKKAYAYMLFGILGSITGALAGYAIGHFAWLDLNGEFTGFAQFLLSIFPGFSEAGYDKMRLLYEKWDYLILFIAAALPLPYKLFSISSGMFDVNLFVFCLSTLAGQGIKFFLMALLTKKLGREVKKLLEFNWKPIAIIATASIAAAILVIKIF